MAFSVEIHLNQELVDHVHNENQEDTVKGYFDPKSYF
jgi:hypothetical protein